MKLLLPILLLLGVLCGSAIAQPASRDGVLKTESGEFYGPSTLEWTAKVSETKSVYRGTEGKVLRVLIVDLPGKSDLKGPGAQSLFKAEVGPELGVDIAQLEMLESLVAPYPWPNSVELRMKLPPDKRLSTAYIGSASGRTIILCTFGSGSVELANSMAFSFKERFQLKREWQAKNNHAKAIVGPLATGATFFFLLAIIGPVGITLFFNRRHHGKHNPFLIGMYGLAASFGAALLFGYILLDRFSGTQTSDYFEVFGNISGRAIFLAVLTGYASKKWREKHDALS